MNEQIQAWLLTQLQKLSNAADAAAGFAAGELPLFVEEFITFTMVWNWFVVVATGLIVLLAVGFWGFAIYKECKKEYGIDSKLLVIGLGGLLCLMPVMFAGSAFLIHLHTAMMVTFAPRVFLLTEFMKFFK